METGPNAEIGKIKICAVYTGIAASPVICTAISKEELATQKIFLHYIPFRRFAELLERVLLRLGNADSDEKLEATVGKFLTPVILKMNSPHNAVRTKASKGLKQRPAGGCLSPFSRRDAAEFAWSG